MIRLRNIWRQIINNGIHEELDFDQVMKIRISNAISIVGSSYAFIYCVFLALHSQYRMAFNDILFISNLMFLYLLNYLGYNRIGTFLTIISVPIMLLYVNYEYGRISTDYFFYSCIVLGFYFFKRRVDQILISLFFIILISITKYLETIIIPNDFAFNVAPYIYISNTIMSLSILFLSIWLFISEHNKYKHEIDSKNQQLYAALELTKQKNNQVNLMLKELNHRVKNNLQMISSLFNIQSYKTKNKETKIALKDARNRIVSIAIMHQKLYKDNLFYKIRLKTYIEELVDYLIQSVGEDENIKVILTIEDIKLHIEDTVHVGLIVNELITNSLKYGTNKKNQSEISINIYYNDNCLMIKIGDNGVGFPLNFDIESTDSFGLDLVKNIVNQHEGYFQHRNNKGAEIELQLKITEISD